MLPVLLMHPSDTRTRTYKLEAQERLMQAVAQAGGWMGDLTAMGRFWRSRSTVAFSTEAGPDGSLIVRVHGSAAELDPAIGFDVSGPVKKVVVMDSSGATLPYSVVSRDGKLYAGREP